VEAATAAPAKAKILAATVALIAFLPAVLAPVV